MRTWRVFAMIVVFTALLCSTLYGDSAEASRSGTSEGLQFSGSVRTYTLLPFPEFTDPVSTCARFCLSWGNFSCGSHTDISFPGLFDPFWQEFWVCQSWEQFSLGGTLTVLPDDSHSNGFWINGGRLSLEVDLLDEVPLDAVNGSTFSAAMGIFASYYNYGMLPLTEPRSWRYTLELTSDVHVGILCLWSETNVSLSSSYVSERAQFYMELIQDDVTITPAAFIWITASPVEVLVLEGSVRTEWERPMEEDAFQVENDSCCAPDLADDGKFTVDLAYTWHCRADYDVLSLKAWCQKRLGDTGLWITPDIEASIAVNPDPFIRWTFGVCLSW